MTEAEKLLKKCLYVLNGMPNAHIGDFTTYKLASQIDEYFRQQAKEGSEGDCQCQHNQSSKL